MNRKRNAFRNSSALASQSLQVLTKDRSLLAYPLVGGALCFVVSIIFGIMLAVAGVFRAFTNSDSLERAGRSSSSDGAYIVGLIILFVYYLVTYTIMTIANAALTAKARAKIEGEAMTLQEGYNAAMAKFGPLFGYAAIAATVGVIASSLRNSGRDSKNFGAMIIGAILSATVLAAWSVISYLAIPVIMFEGLGTFPALQRSMQLFRQTWGESLIGGLSLGCTFGLLTLASMVPGILITVVGAASNAPFLLFVGIILVVVAVAIVALLAGAVNTIFRVALYRYATQGNTGGLLDETLVREAFQTK